MTNLLLALFNRRAAHRYVGRHRVPDPLALPDDGDGTITLEDDDGTDDDGTAEPVVHGGEVIPEHYRGIAVVRPPASR